MSTTPEIFQKLRTLAQVSINRIALAAGKRAEGELKYRIFNEGLDAEDTQIGKYFSGYAAYRAKRGRQTLYVDLELTGELRNAIKLGNVSNGQIALGITNSNRANVATKLEKQYQKTIFALSDNDVKAVESSIVAEINAIFDKL